jgi:hypothetical protein
MTHVDHDHAITVPRAVLRRVCSVAAIIAMLAPPPGWASPAWKDGKSYTAMLADGGAAALKAVQDALSRLAMAKQALQAAQNALSAAGPAAATAATAAAVASAQTAVTTAQAAVASAEAGAPWVAGALAAAGAGTLIGQGLRGLWSACWDPTCGDHFSGVVPLTYTPYTPAQIVPLLPQLTSIATGGAFSTTAADYTALGAEGQAAQAFITDGAALLMDTAEGAAFAQAGDTAQVRAAANNLSAGLASYRTAVANFASYLPTAQLTSPLPAVQSALVSLNTAIATAEAVCDPAGGDNCAALTAALTTAAASYTSALNTLAPADFAALTGGTTPYISDLSLSGFDAFLSACASTGVACLPPDELTLATTLLGDAGVSFAIGPAIAGYDALGDPTGDESALFASGPIDLATLLDLSATELSDCGGPNCRWLLINPYQSPLVPEPSGTWLLITAIIGWLAAVRARSHARRADPAGALGAAL